MPESQTGMLSQASPSFCQHRRTMIPEKAADCSPAISKFEIVLLVAIVLVAAWLRFDHLDRADFQWDQAEISKWALNMARQREITWIGPISSTKLDTFPVAIWLYAIPYAISPSPVFATGFVAVLNLATVVGCYFLARRWFGREAALTATLLYAVAPWAVIYSRRVWHTVLLPPFGLLYGVTGWLAFARGRRWALLAHSLALAILVQIHFSALAFVPLTVLWALIFCKRIDWRVALFSALLAALTFVPYFITDAQKDWRNVGLLAQIAQGPSQTSADATRGTWIVTTGSNLQWLTGPDRYPDYLSATPNIRWLFGVEGGLALVGGLLALEQAIGQAHTGLSDETAASLMTVTWLAMPALFLTRNKTGAVPHYFTTTFPAQFILIGWGIKRLTSLTGRWSRRTTPAIQGILIALVVAIATAQAYETTAVLRFVRTHDTRLGHGTPIVYELQAIKTAMRLGQQTDDTEIIVLSEGDDPRMFEMPAVADVLMYESDMPHRSVDTRGALVIPSSPVVYWATYDMTAGEALLATFTPELTDARISLREGARSFRFYCWPGGVPDLPNMQPLVGTPSTWTNGAQVIGYRLEGDLHPGRTIRWTLVWRVTAPPTNNIRYHWFNHLLDEQGQMRAQNDGPSFLSTYWRTGDTVFNWFNLQIPPDAPLGVYTMRVGMYTYPAIESVLLLNAGDDGENWVEIRLAEVTAP
jgi:4-amino-4-deoxy-L-arabinose transferase-like glycosyltransferase